MASNSPSKPLDINSSSELGRGKKTDGLTCSSINSDERKMCYEDDDKEQDKKKNENHKEETEAKEDPKKSEEPVTKEMKCEKEVEVNKESERKTADALKPENHKEETAKEPSRPKHFYTQRQIDSFTVRVLAMEKTLGNSENRSDSFKVGNKEPFLQHQFHSSSDVTRARSPSVPNTLTLGVPKDGDDREGGLDDTSSSSSRWALSPLLEVRRPHCTLNCENCKIILEERFKHSK